MSAELGLAIAGVAAASAALSKALFGLYHTTRNVSRDVKNIATQLELLRSVLKELQRTLRKGKHIASADAERTIRGYLTQCSDIFDGIEDITAPLRSADGEILPGPPDGERVKFHLQKDELRLLQVQLESLKSSIHLMVSIIHVGRALPSSSRESSAERTSPRLKAALCVASQLVEGERACLTDLLLVEEQVYASPTDTVRFSRISTWLSGVVGLSEQGSAVISLRSFRTLSAVQRSIAGSASNDVEMLVERWTIVSEVRPSELSISEYQSANITASDSTASSFSEEQPSPAPTVQGEAASIRPGDEDAGHQPTPSIQSSESNSDTETETETNSTSSEIELTPYHTTSETVSSDSSSSGTATPTADSVSVNEEALTPLTPAALEPLASILVNHGKDDDNETVRDLRRASLKDRRVRIDIPNSAGPSENRDARVEDWISSSSLTDDASSVVLFEPPSTKNSPYQYHTPFSEVSILSSQAPSEASSISTIRDDETCSRKVHKLVKAGNSLIRLKKHSEAASLFKEAYNLAKSSDEVDEGMKMEINFKIGVVFGELGKFSSAQRVLKGLLRTQRLLLGDSDKAVLLTRHYLGRIYSRQEEWKQAAECYAALWKTRKDSLLPVAPETMDPDPTKVDLALRTGQEYGHVLLESERYDEAMDVLVITHDASKRVRGEEDVKITLESAINLGRAFRALSKFDEATELLAPALDRCTVLFAAENPLRLHSAFELAMMYCEQEKFRECEELARTIWDVKSKSRKFSMSTQYDDFTLDSAECLAKALRGLDRNNEARDMFKIVHRGFLKRFGRTHPRTIKVTDQLAEILLEMEEEYEAERKLTSALVAHRPITNANITEDLTHIAEKLGPLLLKQDKKADAAEVYDSIFLGEKKFLGIDSLLTLANGHQYGTLCFDLHRLPTAENVFIEVWDHRKQVLGEKDLESIASGFQLGQVYFMRNNYEAAVNTHRSILDVRKDLFGPVSAEVIESSEVLGIVFVSNPQSFEQGFQLLYDALESKKQLFGSNSGTLSSALRLASLSASHGKFSDAADLFRWIFDSTKAQESTKMISFASASGCAAAGFHYIQQKHTEGNGMLHGVVANIKQRVGDASPIAQSLAYGQAMLYLLQSDGRECRHILRQQFSMQKKIHGSGHRKSLFAGEVLAIGTLVDSLLKRSRIGEELDKINDWLFAQRKSWTLVMRVAMNASILCAFLHLDELAQALLSWLHRTQKRLFGRFDRETLTTLAVHHAFYLARKYKKIKRIPSKDHTAIDPRILVPKIWPTLTRTIGTVLTKMTTGDQRAKFFTTWLPKLMTEWTLYEGYRRERLTRLFMPQMQQFFFSPKFADYVRNQSQARQRESDDDVASRVWTMASEELGDADDAADDDSFSVDFAEVLDDKATERLKSLGGSLIDLTMGAEDQDEELGRSREERAESRLKDLQSELISEVISEANIDAAKENCDVFEQETDDV